MWWVSERLPCISMTQRTPAVPIGIRHECIGKGYLGSEEFGGGMQVMQNIVSNGRLRICHSFWRHRTNLQVMRLKLNC